VSRWNSDAWEGLVRGTDCPICLSGKPLDVVVDLEASYLTCSEHQAPLRGYCVLVLKRHAVEPHELAPAEGAAFMRDLQIVSRVVQQITGAVKMNFEIHGNTIPHLHLHVFPRYRGDPFEGRPIDLRAVQASHYAPAEFAEFIRQLQSRLM
jgi:diadenosine tetraphosphate (Ap4A) HIT family hydrolase